MSIGAVKSLRGQQRRWINFYAFYAAQKAGSSWCDVRPGFNGSMGQAGCRFIEGDPMELVRARVDPFCGEPTQPGSAYCAEHHRRCFRLRPLAAVKAA